MGDDKRAKTPAQTDRASRQAAALRENLKRRKQQARGRAAQSDALARAAALRAFWFGPEGSPEFGRMREAWFKRDDAFDDFGITSNAMQNHTYIPNDNLEYRPHSTQGPKSGMSIQDANALKIKVTYGYELKVPLMKRVFSAVMCGNFGTVRERAFTDWNSIIGLGSIDDCVNFYLQGRAPIVSYATVQMQTPAWKN